MSARIGQAREHLSPFSFLKGSFELFLSLVGLNVDCAEWVKEGILDEAERLDRHWVNWTSFTQVSRFMLCIPSLTSFS